jgi:hypothetical protein
MEMKEDVMKRRAIRQRTLFDDRVLISPPPLQEKEEYAVKQLLTEWMQALAKIIEVEVKNDKDQR